MNSDRQEAREYLRAQPRGLWRWAEHNTVLVWKDGSTIAFREEIVALIEWLAPGGLPSFGALALLLAACRGKMPSAEELYEPNEPSGANIPAPLQAARRQLTLQLAEALQELARLPGLPSELITGVKAKCVLAETVFEQARAERYVNAAAILRGLREPPEESDWNSREAEPARMSGIRHVHLIALGLRQHSPESLTWRLRTGLDAAPRPVDCELPAAERARRLIDELRDDSEHGAVARAARELLAAVRLPRRLGELEELAGAGVADLSNRGPLDRLLLSELAHDDLTLAVRVALNEALYLRREPPRREPPGTLALLLDSGVRLWGVPRVLGTAVALALIAREKPSSTILQWRAHGNELIPVDLLSRTGLMQHLGVLEPELHPGEALTAFMAALPSGAETQGLLITHRDTLLDPDFRRVLSGLPLGFVATVERDGNFELHALPLSQRRPLCQAQLDLAAVFPSPSDKPPPAVAVDANAPAIFGLTPFPLLLPLAGKIDWAICSKDGTTHAVLNDRRLVSYREWGGRVLAENLPGGRTICMRRVGDVVHWIKAGSRLRPPRLISFPLPAGPVRRFDLEGGADMLAVQLHDDVILVIRTNDVRAFAVSDGRALGKAINPYRWIHGRYFRGENQFHYVAWDGSAPRFEPLPLPKLPAAPRVIFDREGVPGPWLVLENGCIMSSVTGATIDAGVPRQHSGHLCVQVLRDGHEIQFSLPAISWRRLVDLNAEQRWDPAASERPGDSMARPGDLPRWNVLRALEGLARWGGTLALAGRKGHWHRLHGEGGERLRLGELPPPLPLQPELTFPVQPKATDWGCSLHEASWPSGTKVFLDSRGLLHFKSHKRSVPEVSLVLSDGEVAGWTSEGRVCGPVFFFGRTIVSEPQVVFQGLLRILQSA
jgi:hypothetical protein